MANRSAPRLPYEYRYVPAAAMDTSQKMDDLGASFISPKRGQRQRVGMSPTPSPTKDSESPFSRIARIKKQRVNLKVYSYWELATRYFYRWKKSGALQQMVADDGRINGSVWASKWRNLPSLPPHGMMCLNVWKALGAPYEDWVALHANHYRTDERLVALMKQGEGQYRQSWREKCKNIGYKHEYARISSNEKVDKKRARPPSSNKADWKRFRSSVSDDTRKNEDLKNTMADSLHAYDAERLHRENENMERGLMASQTSQEQEMERLRRDNENLKRGLMASRETERLRRENEELRGLRRAMNQSSCHDVDLNDDYSKASMLSCHYDDIDEDADQECYANEHAFAKPPNFNDFYDALNAVPAAAESTSTVSCNTVSTVPSAVEATWTVSLSNTAAESSSSTVSDGAMDALEALNAQHGFMPKPGSKAMAVSSKKNSDKKGKKEKQKRAARDLNSVYVDVKTKYDSLLDGAEFKDIPWKYKAIIGVAIMCDIRNENQRIQMAKRDYVRKTLVSVFGGKESNYVLTNVGTDGMVKKIDVVYGVEETKIMDLVKKVPDSQQRIAKRNEIVQQFQQKM